jgi:hypothetical protein
MQEVVILSEVKNLSCSVQDVRKLKGCHHEPAPGAHASFDPAVPAGRARDLLFASTIADTANCRLLSF